MVLSATGFESVEVSCIDHEYEYLAQAALSCVRSMIVKF